MAHERSQLRALIPASAEQLRAGLQAGDVLLAAVMNSYANGHQDAV
ncbi:MAG: hypothetical protein Q8O64_00120 [Sideroxyarcus sp.]|nr:hypothetical protein [Sideroxyarcus sp.]